MRNALFSRYKNSKTITSNTYTSKWKMHKRTEQKFIFGKQRWKMFTNEWAWWKVLNAFFCGYFFSYTRLSRALQFFSFSIGKNGKKESSNDMSFVLRKLIKSWFICTQSCNIVLIFIFFVHFVFGNFHKKLKFETYNMSRKPAFSYIEMKT